MQRAVSFVACVALALCTIVWGAEPPAPAPVDAPPMASASTALERMTPGHRKLLEANIKYYFVAPDGSIWTDKEQRDLASERDKERKAAYEQRDAPLWFSPDLGAPAKSVAAIRQLVTMRLFAQKLAMIRDSLQPRERIVLSGFADSGEGTSEQTGHFIVVTPAALAIFTEAPDIAALILAGVAIEGDAQDMKDLVFTFGTLTGYPAGEMLQPCIVRLESTGNPDAGEPRRWSYVCPLADRAGGPMPPFELVPATPEQIANAIDAGRMPGLPNWFPRKYKAKEGRGSVPIYSGERRAKIWRYRKEVGKTKEVEAEYAFRWELRWTKLTIAKPAAPKPDGPASSK